MFLNLLNSPTKTAIAIQILNDRFAPKRLFLEIAFLEIASACQYSV